jgi:hypothetical protein
LFSPRANHVQFSLEYIAENLQAPTTVLHYPSRRELIAELRKHPQFVGISFVLSTLCRRSTITAAAASLIGSNSLRRPTG